MSMLQTLTIEERLALLEKAVARIEQRLNAASSDPNWLEKMSGCSVDDEALMKAFEYGQEWRRADRPPDEESAPT